METPGEKNSKIKKSTILCQGDLDDHFKTLKNTYWKVSQVKKMYMQK